MDRTSVIFLDIDGVLHSTYATDDGFFTPAAMQALKWLIDHAPAPPLIVLSSSWRHLPGAPALVDEALKRWGIPTVHSWTPSADLAVARPMPRALEIQQWLQANQSLSSAWVVLDDLDLVHTIEDDDADSDFGSDDDICGDGDGGEQCLKYDFLLPHFVRTDGMVGLTMADAAEAVQILANDQ